MMSMLDESCENQILRNVCFDMTRNLVESRAQCQSSSTPPPPNTCKGPHFCLPKNIVSFF